VVAGPSIANLRFALTYTDGSITQQSTSVTIPHIDAGAVVTLHYVASYDYTQDCPTGSAGTVNPGHAAPVSAPLTASYSFLSTPAEANFFIQGGQNGNVTPTATGTAPAGTAPLDLVLANTGYQVMRNIRLGKRSGGTLVVDLPPPLPAVPTTATATPTGIWFGTIRPGGNTPVEFVVHTDRAADGGTLQAGRTYSTTVTLQADTTPDATLTISAIVVNGRAILSFAFHSELPGPVPTQLQAQSPVTVMGCAAAASTLGFEPDPVVVVRSGVASVTTGGLGGAAPFYPGVDPLPPPQVGPHEVVQLQIADTGSLDRPAYTADLQIASLTTEPLTDLRITPMESVPSAFAVAPATDGGGYAVGTIPPDTGTDTSWTLIPGPSASGSTYTVWAHYSYRYRGQLVEADTAPRTVAVPQLPLLRVKYTLPNTVRADVPFTLQVEVDNLGNGTARHVQLGSGWPTILNSHSGVPVNFSVLGATIDGRPVALTSNQIGLDFGDILGATATATPTATPAPGATSTDTPIPTRTNTPTDTPIPTDTPNPLPTAVIPPTATPIVAPSAVPTVAPSGPNIRIATITLVASADGKITDYEATFTEQPFEGVALSPLILSEETFIDVGDPLPGPDQGAQLGHSPSLFSQDCGAVPTVHCFTGNFSRTWTDLSFAHSRGVPVVFSRTYNSRAPTIAHNVQLARSSLGKGWTSNYEMQIAEPVDDTSPHLTLVEEGGSSLGFDKVSAAVSATGYKPTFSWVFATMGRDTIDGREYFVFGRGDGTRYLFAVRDDFSGQSTCPVGRLCMVEDRNGHRTTLQYQASIGPYVVRSATDESGRTLTFRYDLPGDNSLLTSITDSAQRTVSFTYDGNAELQTVTDVGGGVTAYGYDNNLLTTIREPEGGLWRNAYDSDGRVLLQTDPLGRQSVFGYADDSATAGAGSQTTTICQPAVDYGTGMVDAACGHGRTTVAVYRQGTLTAMTRGANTADAATWVYVRDPLTLGVAAVRDPDGRVGYNQWDARGNLLSTTEPLDASTLTPRTTAYTYSKDYSEVTQIIDPAGVKTTFTYDGQGNLRHTDHDPALASDPRMHARAAGRLAGRVSVPIPAGSTRSKDHCAIPKSMAPPVMGIPISSGTVDGIDRRPCSSGSNKVALARKVRVT